MSRRSAIGLALLLATVASFVAVCQRIDWAATWAALAGLGYAAPLVLVPYLAVLVCDCSGWAATFRRGDAVRMGALFRIRMASEAIANSLPAGVAVAEAFKAVALQRQSKLRMGEAIANGMVSKAALTVAHALFLIVGVVLARPVLRSHSQQLIGRPGLDDIGLAGACTFLALVCTGALLLTRGSWLASLRGLLGPLRRARVVGASREGLGQGVERALNTLNSLPRVRLLRAVLFFAAGWTAMALETWILLRLLSTNVPLASAISIEAVVSIVKVAFFFIPSALGAQEASYYLLLRMYGVPNAEVVASAFVIVKRAKELVWMGLGYGALSTMNVGAAVRRAPVPRLLTRSIASTVHP